MFSEVARFGFCATDNDAKCDNQGESYNATNDELEDEAGESSSAFGFNRAVLLGDLVEILEVIHGSIVTYDGTRFLE